VDHDDNGVVYGRAHCCNSFLVFVGYVTFS
jgi:hypothetical protein